MLSATKHLGPAREILRFAQDDNTSIPSQATYGSAKRTSHLPYPPRGSHKGYPYGLSVGHHIDNSTRYVNYFENVLVSCEALDLLGC